MSMAEGRGASGAPWRSNEMGGEPVMFVRDGTGRANGSLLLEARKVRRVTDWRGECEYEEGRDWVLEGGRRLVLAEGSRICEISEEEMYPAAGAANAIAGKAGSERHLLFSEDGMFARLQALVTYEHKGWDGPVPESAAERLAKTHARLRRGGLKVVVFGDSISAGSNATAVMGMEPGRAAFGDQVAAGLREAFGAEVKLVNEAVGGKDAKWGVENIGVVARHEPELVIVGWGMNDASGRRPPGVFCGMVVEQMEAIRKVSGDAEFVLIATMTGNPEWTFSGGDLYEGYRRELLGLEGEGVAVADMTTVWRWVLTRKRFVDVTGNGVNHPNDFGHWLYAQVLLEVIGVGRRAGGGRRSRRGGSHRG